MKALTMNENPKPRIGVAVFVMKNGSFLMGKRKSNHGYGTWAVPGGHLEWLETPELCGEREVTEECGLKIANIRKLTFTNNIFGADKHYVTLWLMADYVSGEPQLLEPDKCEEWRWVTWDTMPRPLFFPEIMLLADGFTISI